ncbi:sensor histidine kinase [Halovulum sp. GXIMD14793]
MRSDPTYLRRIAQNLVSNAIKYSGQGRVLVWVRHQDNRALLEVWDTGPGILPQDQERIFGEFQRLNETSGLPGMGLGLSIVQRACAQLGHKLELESMPGRGSVFRIYMDVMTADAIRAEVPAAEVPTDPLSNIIALVVENDAEMRVAMTVQLENWGMGVLDVSGSQSAVDLIREVDVLPDLIIADYQLDNNDTGLDAIRLVRDQTPHDIPALLVTADRSKAVHQAAALNIPVMAKPVDPQKLQDAIRALTGRKP